MTSMDMTEENRDRAALYDHLAPLYDKLHRRWLTYAGGEAQAALEGIVRAIVTPGTELLDAGCGTGSFVRNLIAEGMPPEKITLLDSSEAMLARCDDIPSLQMRGRLENLPFADASFDIVTCAWALETVSETERAVYELGRVIKPRGLLCLAFCADRPAKDLKSWAMRQAVLWRGSGRFLATARVTDALMSAGEFEVRQIPVGGPAATILARRF